MEGTAQPACDAWGVTTTAAPTNSVALLNRYGYASGYTDGTGLIKFGTRYYNPTLGVWTQSDPASQGANYYIYAGSDPNTNTDPTGRWESEYSENDGFDWGEIGTVAGEHAAAGAAVGKAIAPGGGTLVGAVVGAFEGATFETIAQDVPSDYADNVRQRL